MSRVADAARLAVGTLTVLPVPPPGRVDRRVGALAMALAPVAALVPAVAAAAVVWLAGLVVAPPLLGAVLALGVLALASGGLHLDGLADTADGLTVPGDRDRRLEVMRRGDVGPAGAAALVLVLLAQAAALADLVAAGGALATVVAVAASRGAVTLACVRGVPAARDDGLGRSVAGSVPPVAAAVVWVVVGAAGWLVAGPTGLAAAAAVLLVTGLVLRRAVRRLGGVTGDVMGACVELALAAYLVALAVG